MKNLFSIHIEKNNLRGSGEKLDIEFKKKFYILNINKSIIPKGLRKGDKYLIFNNNIKIGSFRYHYGVPPLPKYKYSSQTDNSWFNKFLYYTFCLANFNVPQGYCIVKLGKMSYIIIDRFTKDNSYLSYVYSINKCKHRKNEFDTLGVMIFKSNLKEVHINCGSRLDSKTSKIIATCMSDILIKKISDTYFNFNIAVFEEQ